MSTLVSSVVTYVVLFPVSLQPVSMWDMSYYTGLGRHQAFNINSMELAPYFSLGCCMEGLSQVFEALFGVTLQYTQPQYGELWSYDVHKLVSGELSCTER